jgi:predicted glycogen debranching enzyme
VLSKTNNSFPRINLKSNDLADLEKVLKNEWLVTNGLGGYASSTVLGLNTRKYHGLLVAAFNPPVDRHVLLAKLDEEVSLDNQTYLLEVNEDTHGTQAEGLRFLTNFSLDPFPTYMYNIENEFHLKKTIFIQHEHNVSIINYEALNTSEKSAKLSIAPLINFRNFHSVTQRDRFSGLIQKSSDHRVVIQPSNGQSTLILFSNEGRYVAEPGEWVESYYRIEAQRGESSVDYNYKPGFFEFQLEPNQTRNILFLAVVGRNDNEAERIFYVTPKDISTLHESETKRRADSLDNFSKCYPDLKLEDWLKWLILATDAFLVNRELAGTKSVIAGYHWFNDWGRDSLISLPGLSLVNKRFDEAKSILLTFKHYCNKGVIPNAFPDSAEGAPAYNTVDATLWYFNAILQFLKYTNEFQFVQEELWSTLELIVENHVHGTFFDIHMDQDGLIAHGPQLTWMDAAPGGTPVTPRDGKAVEVQALWYNALKTMQLLAHCFGQEDRAETYRLMAEKTRRNFLEKFWNQQKSCLFDVVVNNADNDASLRPNQILAVSLDFSTLDKAMAEQVVTNVWKQLLTPFGLRTLERNDSRYIGKYFGDRWQRDKAYHNGTVWPWLLGPFVTAFLKLKNHEAQWRSFAFENFLKPLFTEELCRVGLGSISEIFNGDPPHEPNGCIAQTWSIAEPLRAYMEDVSLKRPSFEQKVFEQMHVM